MEYGWYTKLMCRVDLLFVEKNIKKEYYSVVEMIGPIYDIWQTPMLYNSIVF